MRSYSTLGCSWQRSGLAAWSCCTRRKSFCWSHCCGLSSRLLHTKDPPVAPKQARSYRRQDQNADDNIMIVLLVTCTSIEVVSSTTLFITARTFRGSMVLTQSRVSTLFLSIWEMIRPWTFVNEQTTHKCVRKSPLQKHIRAFLIRFLH